jgi:hypothetical protein
MSYIGSNYTQQLTTPAVDYFNGNGVTTTFQLTRSVTSVNAIQVVVNNVPQNAREAYGINASNQIVFTSAPSAGANNIYVIYDSQVGQFVTPSPGTVGTSALAEVTNIRSGASNLSIQTGVNNTTAVTVDQNQFLNVNNPNYSLAKLHVSLTDRVRNTTLMNSNNTNTLAVLSAPFNSPELTANNNAKWGLLFHGNGDFNTTPAGLATTLKSAGIYAVSEDTAAGYNRQVGLAFHTCSFDQGHREAFRINGAGVVTKPFQPAFQAMRGVSRANQATFTGDSDVLQFDQTIYNIGSAYNTANFRFTAPVAGRYLFSCTARYDGTPAGSYNRLLFTINGNALSFIYGHTISGSGHSTDYESMTVSAVLNLAVGDFVDVRGGRNGGGGALQFESQFSGILIG